MELRFVSYHALSCSMETGDVPASESESGNSDAPIASHMTRGLFKAYLLIG
jgi:hypothetical protein